MTTLHPIPRHWRSTWPAMPQLRLRPAPRHDLASLRAALPARAATPQAPLAAAVLLSLAVGVVATLPEFTAVDRGWWQARFLAPASVGGLVAWLLAARRPPLAIAVRPHAASLARGDAVAAGLVLTALVLVLLALGGLLPRIAAGGLTPNRAAALGADLLLLVHLGAVLRSYGQARRTGRGIAVVQAALAGWLPAYGVWATVVAAAGFAAG